jgi:hypothetical protein
MRARAAASLGEGVRGATEMIRPVCRTWTWLLMVALVATCLAAAGCGDSNGGDGKTSPRQEAAEQGEGSEEGVGAVPASLGQVESGAEDTIDFANEGARAQVVKKARALRQATVGAAADLREAGVGPARIRALQQRAALLETLTARADLVRVSLAANEVSALMPEFYARYKDPVPPEVLRLDYLDREAQLRSLAGDRASISSTVRELASTWTELRPQVLDAKGKRVATRYDRHVRSMRRRARGANDDALQREAVRGLELVDELEQQFRAQ